MFRGLFRVKVCGITNWTDARRAVDCGAEALGFNFYPASPRYVRAAEAQRIAKRLPRGVGAVGVFVDEPLETVREIARIVGLDFAQLHGDESPASAAAIGRGRAGLPVIKAFRVAPGFRPAVLARFEAARAFLLDGFSPGLRGGTGRTVDWALARRAARYGKIILAGGLNPENIAEAIRAARPAAVDVNSGVESAPGRKDPAKLRALFDAVNSARDFFS